MKKGVYDYVVKPINSDDLLIKVGKAEELARLKDFEKAVERESEIRTEKMLNFNIWKESALARDTDRFDSALFQNLRKSFSQGAGFGLLLSLLALIRKEVKKEQNQYIIDEQLMQLISENADIAQKAI